MFSSKTASATMPSISIPSFPSRLVHRFLVLASIVVILHFLRLQSSFAGWPAEWKQHKTYSACEDLRSGALNDTLVIMKTGANEAPEKLPAHFDTTLRCVPHYVIYSDLNETIEGHHVYDALDEVNPEIKMTHPDFRYYQALQDEGRAAFTDDQLTEWSAAGNTGLGRNTPGWKLDKWKFLPMADKAFRLKPDAKWFVFVEADTYVIWRNMVAWLAHHDASKPYYLGMQMQVQGQVFGYGGAGFVLSNPALKRLVEYRNGGVVHWDAYTGKHWAGDCVLGQALKSAGIYLSFSWPNLVSENPVDMDFNATFGGKKYFWCYYATTYHHLTPQEIVEFSEFEQDWNQKWGMLRHKDSFRHFILPQLGPDREDWDNLSDTVRSWDSASTKHCRQICESQPDCVQFSLADRTCKTGTIVKLGRPQRPSIDGQQRIVSGWMMDRVHTFMARMEESCKGDLWNLH